MGEIESNEKNIIRNARNIVSETIIFRGKYFKTIEYLLKNGNKIKETIPTWIQTDFGNAIKETTEEKIEKKAFMLRHGR